MTWSGTRTKESRSKVSPTFVRVQGFQVANEKNKFQSLSRFCPVEEGEKKWSKTRQKLDLERSFIRHSLDMRTLIGQKLDKAGH